MLLADARSEREVEEALADGDEELLADIEDQIDNAVEEISRDFEHNIEREESDLREYVELLAEAVRKESPVDLSSVPNEFLVDEISQELDAFDVEDDTCRGKVSIMTLAHSYYVWVDPSSFIENAELIPQHQANSFYEKLEEALGSYSMSWSHGTNALEAQSAWLDDYQGEPSRVCIDEDRLTEICYDAARSWIREHLRRDPSAAVEAFLLQLASFDARVSRRLRDSLPPEADMLELAGNWSMADGDEDRELVVQEINDYLDAITGPPGEEIERFDRGDIREMGIYRGTLYENAPWILTKLAPSQLRAEGVMMKHCVGDRSMGYIKRVSDGDIEIWSLRRESDNKPRFTLEVDSAVYDEDASPRERAGSILQLKGTANRLPGYDRKMSLSEMGQPTKPDEIVFWARVFEGLGIDPYAVDDLDLNSVEPEEIKSNRGARRQARSFDEPSRPRRT